MAEFNNPIDRLLSQLMTSGLQVTDNPLFQVIAQLIRALQILQSESGQSINTVINNAGAQANLTYITETDETALLPFSRRLNAGINITFDLSVPGVFTISAQGGGEWYPLSNGNVDNPEIIFANGAVIMVHVP